MSTLSTTNLKNPGSGSNNIVLGADGSITVSALQGGITSGTAVASTSGTSIDFTGIPSWVKRVTVMLNGVSTNGTNSPIIQLGTSGGIETTNYLGACLSLAAGGNGAANNSSGLILGTAGTAAATSVRHGSVVLSNISGNTWTAQGVIGSSEGAYAAAVGGSKALSAILTQLRITTVNGTDTFDAGSVNILYEG